MVGPAQRVAAVQWAISQSGVSERAACRALGGHLEAVLPSAAVLELYHNAFLIHDDVEMENKTGQGQPEGPEPGPILLQDHGSPVQFRNLWILPLR